MELRDGVQTSNPSLHRYALYPTNIPNSSNARSNSNGSIDSMGNSMGSMGSLQGPKIKMGTLLSPGSRAMNNQRIQPSLVRPLDPNMLLQGTKKQSLSEGALRKNHSSEMLATSFGKMSMKEEANNEEDETDSDDMTSEESESEWESEIVAGNVSYIVPFTTREAVTMFQQAERDQTESGGGVPSKDLPQQSKQQGKNLSRMVRRRESKRDRNINVGGSNVVLKTPSGRPQLHLLRKGSNKRSSAQEISSDNDSSTYGQIKTFEAFFEASNLDESVAAAPVVNSQEVSNSVEESETRDEVTEIHEVTLKFNSKQLKSQIPHFQMLLHGDNPANRGLLLENLLGIIPESKTATSSEPFEILDNSVVVSSLLPNGPAYKCEGKVKPGDIIRSLDGHHVTIETANTYLLHKLSKASHSSSTGKVKLIIQRPIGAAASLKERYAKKDNMDESSKREAILYQYTELSREQWRLIIHSNVFAMVMSTNAMSPNAPDQADLMYQFPPDDPRSDKAALPPVVRARGVFSTLMQLLPDVIASVPLTSSVLIEGSSKSHDVLMHVGYIKENDEMLLFGLPGSLVSENTVKKVVQQVSRLILLKYGSIANAALGSTSELDTIFGRVIYDILTKGSSSRWVDLEVNSWLQLPDDIQFQVEDAMNQFESSDFQEFSDDFYDLPREFNILGCTLFHRGQIIASHLSKADQEDIVLWLGYENVLALTSEHPVHKLVIWHELLGQANQERRFMLITGLGYQLLGVLLETGGCTSIPTSVVKPDPFYVDQAINTLEHLTEMGIPLVCEKWLSLPNNPPLMEVDSVFTSAAKAKKIDIKSATENAQQAQTASVVLKRTKSLDFSDTSSSERSVSPRHRRDRSDDTHSSYEMSTAFRGEDKDDSNWELPRNGRRSFTSLVPADEEVNRKASMRSSGSGALSTTYSSSSYTSGGAKADEIVTYNISNLTISLHNTLIYYMHLDHGDGVILAPQCKDSPGQLRKILIDNFKNAVQIIHSTLQCCSTQRSNLRSTSSGQEHNPWISKSLVAVKEQGMLFRWSPIETLPVFSYWVTGRVVLTPEPKECYVAYHESAPQQLVELAFRLTFGLHL